VASQTSPRHRRRSNESADTVGWRSPRKTLPLGSAPLPWHGAAVKFPAGDTAHTIGRRMLALVREHTGSGPTEANAVIAADLVVVTLTDCLTAAEQEVIAAGRGDLALRTCDLLRDGIRAEATAIVEEVTQSPVAAYLTAQHQEPDLALLIFYLAPAPLRIA
jgi:uncharacterized protein YbcI